MARQNDVRGDRVPQRGPVRVVREEEGVVRNPVLPHVGEESRHEVDDPDSLALRGECDEIPDDPTLVPARGVGREIGVPRNHEDGQRPGVGTSPDLLVGVEKFLQIHGGIDVVRGRRAYGFPECLELEVVQRVRGVPAIENPVSKPAGPGQFPMAVLHLVEGERIDHPVGVAFLKQERTVTFTGSMNTSVPQPVEICGKDALLRFDGIAHDATGFTILPERHVTRTDLPKGYDRAKTPRQPNHLEDFFNCVRSRGTPKCAVDEAFVEVATFLMSVESFQKQRIVRWDPAREEIV